MKTIGSWRSSESVRLAVLAGLCWAMAGCGNGGDREGDAVDPGPSEPVTIEGRVIEGTIADARVCLDRNRSGVCDGDEPQTFTNTAGRYALTIPKGSGQPLLAELDAGRSRDVDRAGTAGDASSRMASPSVAYSVDITPLSTMVHLAGRSDHALRTVGNGSGHD